MTGVSLRHRGGEHLALPGGLDALRAGRTGGPPLLAPWANRLSRWRYRAAGVTVDLDGLPLGVDDNGLPIHGLLVGRPGWSVDRLATRGDTARLRGVDRRRRARRSRSRTGSRSRRSRASTRLRVDTTIVPTGRRPVPIAFGWHPYLRLPGVPREPVAAAAPGASAPRARRRAASRPATSRPEPAEAEPIGRRTFDDGYAPRARPPPRDRERRRSLGRAAVRRRLPVRAGVGPAGQAVRRARADGGAHQRARRPQGTGRLTAATRSPRPSP